MRFELVPVASNGAAKNRTFFLFAANWIISIVRKPISPRADRHTSITSYFIIIRSESSRTNDKPNDEQPSTPCVYQEEITGVLLERFANAKPTQKTRGSVGSLLWIFVRSSLNGVCRSGVEPERQWNIMITVIFIDIETK